FFFSGSRRHTRSKRDWSSDVCSSDLFLPIFGLFRRKYFSIQFQSGEIAEYFLRKRPKIGRKEDILSYLDRVGDANLLQQKGRNEIGRASCREREENTARVAESKKQDA